MHELGIVFHMIDLLEDLARDEGLEQIGCVRLALGEVSGVVEDYLQDCWRWAADRSEVLRGAELEVRAVPAVTVCRDCGRTYPTVAHGRTCPHCGSDQTELLHGLEIEILEIEAC